MCLGTLTTDTAILSMRFADFLTGSGLCSTNSCRSCVHSASMVACMLSEDVGVRAQCVCYTWSTCGLRACGHFWISDLHPKQLLLLDLGLDPHELLGPAHPYSHSFQPSSSWCHSTIYDPSPRHPSLVLDRLLSVAKRLIDYPFPSPSRLS